MKIRFMKSDSLYILKDTIKDNVENYSLSNNLWIKEATSDNNNFIDFKCEFPDFDLIISDNPEKDDLDNIKLLYTNMKKLTDSQASDERLWAGLCHDTFWNYMQKRWPMEKASDKIKFIKKNYFFAHGEKRSLMTNGLARLWWIGRLTYDETNEENPFELTEYLSKDFNGKGFPLFGSNFSNNRFLLRRFLYFIKDFETTNNVNLSRTQFIEMIKTMNMWSGKLMIDSLSKDVLDKKLNDRLVYVINTYK